MNGSRQADSPLLHGGDALLIVDVQRDFLPGGTLGVPRGDEVVAVLNRYIHLFTERNLPVVLSRDWHPADHCSFQARGGPWPAHCIAGSPGADFARDLAVPARALVISKAVSAGEEAYSAFQHTGLGAQLRALGCRQLYVGGLATDYCVRASVLDALQQGFAVQLLLDAIRAVNLHPDDGAAAERAMIAAGAGVLTLDALAGKRPPDRTP